MNAAIPDPPQLVDRLYTDLRRAMEFVRNQGDALAALAESVERVRVDDDDDDDAATRTASPPPVPVEEPPPQLTPDAQIMVEQAVLAYAHEVGATYERARQQHDTPQGAFSERSWTHLEAIPLSGLPEWDAPARAAWQAATERARSDTARRAPDWLIPEEEEEEEAEGEDDDESVDSWDTEEEEEEVVDEINMSPPAPLAPGLAQMLRAVQDARADYESASTNRFNAGELMIELDNEYERLVVRNERRRAEQQRLVAQARRRWESATREEQHAAQRRRDLELLLAQRRYAEPLEAVVLYNRPNPETLRQSIRTLVDQTLEAHVTRQRLEGRPAPLPLMWQEAVRQVQSWFPDQPRAFVATSLQWNRLREGVARQAHEEEPSVEERRELATEATWQQAAREFMEEFGASYTYSDREETEDLAGAQTAEIRTQAWHTYVAERKQRLIAEMEELEAKMEAEEIDEGEYLEGMNRLKRRYSAIGRRWRSLGA